MQRLTKSFHICQLPYSASSNNLLHFFLKIRDIILQPQKRAEGTELMKTFIITEVHIWQASKRVKIKKSFVTRCTLIRPEFFLKVSCVFIFLLHDLIENPSKISEILLCNLKKGLKGQNSGQTFKVGITNPRGFFDLSNFYLVKLVSQP